MSFDIRTMTPRQIRRAMDVRRADAILIFGTTSKVAIAEALLRRPARCPITFSADTNIEKILPTSARDWARLMVYRTMSRRITEAWALGQSNDQAFRLLGFKRLRTLPFYSVTFDELGAARTDVADARDKQVALLAIGRLAPEKNLEALVQAVADPLIRPRVNLTIVGDGPVRAALEQLMRALPAPNVRLVGAVPHARLGGYFAEADALVIPSCNEPWGNVVTEALGMGLPVLATPAVGAAISTAGRYGGVEIAPGLDAGSLREGLLRFLSDLPLLARAAVEQSGRARAEFGVDAVAQRMVDAIGELRAQ
jgi:glycosyltransferase involved in cell wall biosynthesis